MTHLLSTKPKQITPSTSLPLCKKEMSMFAHTIISFINLTHHQRLAGSFHRLSHGFFISNNLVQNLIEWILDLKPKLYLYPFHLKYWFLCGSYGYLGTVCFCPFSQVLKKLGYAFDNTICWGKIHYEMQQIYKRHLEKNTLM